MADWGTLELCAVGVIALAMVSSGVVVGGISPPALDDGTATVTVVTAPAEQLRIDEGRFGTGVLYLRVPDLTVRVTELRGTPRLNYRVEIPALDATQTSTTLLTDPERRTVTVPGVDRAFERESIARERYTATVSVSVQSFAANDPVYVENATVEVAP